MQYLSFKFYFRWIKNFWIFSSLFFRLAVTLLVIFILWNGDYTLIKTIEVVAFMIFYVSLSSIFDFLLYKSKTVQTDKEYLFIEQKDGTLQKVHISCIEKLQRKFHYFYKIQFKKDCLLYSDLYIFISPNPSFSRPKKFVEIMDRIKNKFYA